MGTVYYLLLEWVFNVVWLIYFHNSPNIFFYLHHERNANQLEHFRTKVLSLDFRYGNYFDNKKVYVIIGMIFILYIQKWTFIAKKLWLAKNFFHSFLPWCWLKSNGIFTFWKRKIIYLKYKKFVKLCTHL